jgi:pimeloyl-ACP methyl ester carboxylesterase
MSFAAPDFAAPGRRRGFLDRSDCRIAYEVTGEGPPIVFAHGLGGGLMSWWQQVAHFAPRHTCIAFSHRGFWPSTAPAGGPDPRAYAGDLAALVDHLGLGAIRIVGQSMGGWTGVEYAIANPGRVTALVLAATTGSLDPSKVPGAGPRLAAWQEQANAAKADLAARNILPACGAAMAEAQPAMHHLYAQIDAASAGLDKEAVRARIGAMRVRPPTDLIAAQCPVLFIPGGQDVVLPPFAGALMAPLIPGARVAPIPAAGHSAYFECAATFNALLAGFFAEQG